MHIGGGSAVGLTGGRGKGLLPLAHLLTWSSTALQGFIALAKWEDRGFYAMRASAEKAQRYLHRCVVDWGGSWCTLDWDWEVEVSACSLV